MSLMMVCSTSHRLRGVYLRLSWPELYLCVFQFIVLYGGRLLFHVEADCFSISWCTGAEIVKRFEPSFFSFLFFLFFFPFFFFRKSMTL